MKLNTIVVTGMAVAGALAVIGWMIFRQSLRLEAAPTDFGHVFSPEAAKQATTPATPPPDTVPAEPTIQSDSPSIPQQAKADAQQNAAPPSPTSKPKAPLLDPVARVALSLVGADADAEQYWLVAIYDPSLPDHEREDLMEDLNEAGLSDPRKPAPEDWPLIVNRIRIIEEIAPHADEFMLPHLAEAYQDLVNLWDGRAPQ